MSATRLVSIFALSAALLGCGGAADPLASSTLPAAAPEEDAPPALLALVGSDASFVARMDLARLRASDHHGAAMSLFEQTLPEDYAARDAAREFAERTSHGVLALVDRGERRGSFLYLLRGSYDPSDLDALVVHDVPLSEDRYRSHAIRQKGEVGAALLGDHTWLFGSVALIHAALDRNDGLLARGELRSELVEMLSLVDAEAATLGLAMVPSDSVHSLFAEHDPDRPELSAHLVSLGARVDISSLVEFGARARSDSAEGAVEVEGWVAEQVAALRGSVVVTMLGLDSALSEADLRVEGVDVLLEVEAQVPATFAAPD